MIHAVGEPVECGCVFTLISRAVRRAGMREKTERKREREREERRANERIPIHRARSETPQFTLPRSRDEPRQTRETTAAPDSDELRRPRLMQLPRARGGERERESEKERVDQSERPPRRRENEPEWYRASILQRRTGLPCRYLQPFTRALNGEALLFSFVATFM
ncbi:hypothetical protein ALC60_10609 [Trachymyrmex zeteki]|uniref:Uncharacterized protein n=1 Tax=Mycetomoellerius zeteki TaxID=64791 RepID=A0A151WR06_9HYME|nr:hypothetical protein ALC60_10609 [Trachymyrmex zeteki]